MRHHRRAASHTSSIIQLFLCVALTSTTAGQNRWVHKPTAEQFRQTPGLSHATFDSRFMQTEVGYCVVLPPSYQKKPRQRYPVVYWLHGGGGNETASLFVAGSWASLYRSGECNEVILVFPNGHRSGYMDHHDGSVMVESMIIRELIPLIDKTYRTRASAAGRAVHGFSMGSSGALKFAFKYPQLFCAAVGYGGGAIDLQNSNSRFILDILERNLKSDPELIRNNNTYHFLKQNGHHVRDRDIRFLLICGEDDSWSESAKTFHRALSNDRIPAQLSLVPGVGHNLRGLIQAEGTAAARFQDKVFRENQPEVVREAYKSAAEGGRLQSFEVVLPPGFQEDQNYPLIVQIFGAGTFLPTRARPFIRVRPSARGVWGYRSMSRYDVLSIVDRMLEKYPVDADRVYLTGTSAGATGAMQTAALRPDRFAAVVPQVAFGTDLPLKNFCNLPVRCEHGINDWTSAIGNVRVQFQKLRALGYDAVLNEHPTAGHGIRIPPPRTLDWLFTQRRTDRPRRVVYSCEHPSDGTAYWLTIESLANPHLTAHVDATSVASRLVIRTQNVSGLAVNLDQLPGGPTATVEIDGDELEVKARSGRVFLRRMADRWNLHRDPLPEPTIRPYGAGGAAELFQGEPLLVVYGTRGSPQETKLLRALAEKLERCGGPHFQPAQVRFPVKSDTDVTADDLAGNNLLAVGTVENHAILQRIADRLPYKVEKQQLMAGHRQPLPVAGSILSCHYYNPEHPRRAMYIVSPYPDAALAAELPANPLRSLVGSDGFRRIDQPDLVVQTADGKLQREMQFDANWRFLEPGGEQQRVPTQFRDRRHLGAAFARVMREESGADFGLWWGPTDRGLFGGYDFNWLLPMDPRHYSLADFRVRHGATESMTAELSGEELKEIHQRWIRPGELLTWPVLEGSEIQTDRTYSIVIPMDLVPKLGIRRKTLSGVAAGPAVTPQQIARAIFETDR